LCIAFLFLLTPITWGAPTDVKRLATPTRRQGVADHANGLGVTNSTSGNVAMRLVGRGDLNARAIEHVLVTSTYQK
jgi:hypothetical protein